MRTFKLKNIISAIGLAFCFFSVNASSSEEEDFFSDTVFLGDLYSLGFMTEFNLEAFKNRIVAKTEIQENHPVKNISNIPLLTEDLTEGFVGYFEELLVRKLFLKPESSWPSKLMGKSALSRQPVLINEGFADIRRQLMRLKQIEGFSEIDRIILSFGIKEACSSEIWDDQSTKSTINDNLGAVVEFQRFYEKKYSRKLMISVVGLPTPPISRDSISQCKLGEDKDQTHLSEVYFNLRPSPMKYLEKVFFPGYAVKHRCPVLRVMGNNPSELDQAISQVANRLEKIRQMMNEWVEIKTKANVISLWSFIDTSKTIKWRDEDQSPNCFDLTDQGHTKLADTVLKDLKKNIKI